MIPHNSFSAITLEINKFLCKQQVNLLTVCSIQSCHYANFGY